MTITDLRALLEEADVLSADPMYVMSQIPGVIGLLLDATKRVEKKQDDARRHMQNQPTGRSDRCPYCGRAT